MTLDRMIISAPRSSTCGHTNQHNTTGHIILLLGRDRGYFGFFDQYQRGISAETIIIVPPTYVYIGD